ncbi:DUF1559 domain-containing protein [Gimesia sp.]|uniref:DUF1559 family PulG-like putative transporter n=1 Tax=Gimesia sp. TaxID=2024833 RepID=UPI000C511AA9|nr:DUF1559 domain-containing protein [Gimesia sp.]MAX38278.1 hypothetical protein [Gimesia sp.]HBL43392.1 hypothetical protein [Planctomycetaceae bacterium]|tara:strand:- start:478 stop:1209 length:732 start_codon:yes stop_codon:yes gene_type:complete
MKFTKHFALSTIDILVILMIIAILAILLLPEVQQGRTSARRDFFRSQIKQISLALHQYQADYGCLPPPVVKDEQGLALHSWRALLLPYFNSAHHLKDRRLDYHFNEPWNSPHNQELAIQNKDLYQLDWQPQNGPRRKSRLVAVIDDTTFWNESSQCRKLPDSENRGQQILLIEIPGSGINWNTPADITLDELLAWSRQDLFDDYGPLALFADGHIEWLSPQELQGDKLQRKLQRPSVSMVKGM